uniref:Uncharacterized protein n=1 Tax=Mycena chlorophos TaxID=658473 RepID=A0ABQ0LEI9_MYCCL|nr:predicted protein [Mycena chlorophos]
MGLFPTDLMHWASLNWTDLMLSLIRGTITCEAPDTKDSWTWAKSLSSADNWEAHGTQVEEATPWLPGSFGRAPRNPKEKLSSGYKAWEFQLYVHGLGPAFFKEHLPVDYWRHFCKGVWVIRVFHQHSIAAEQLVLADQLAFKWVTEFETLYYQCLPQRLHFVRQSIGP